MTVSDTTLSGTQRELTQPRLACVVRNASDVIQRGATFLLVSNFAKSGRLAYPLASCLDLILTKGYTLTNFGLDICYQLLVLSWAPCSLLAYVFAGAIKRETRLE